MQRLEPVAGQPLSVVTVNNTGSHTVSLKMSPELLGLLQDSDPAVRASAARAIELIGGKAPLAAAYHLDAGVPQGGAQLFQPHWSATYYVSLRRSAGRNDRSCNAARTEASPGRRSA